MKRAHGGEGRGGKVLQYAQEPRSPPRQRAAFIVINPLLNGALTTKSFLLRCPEVDASSEKISMFRGGSIHFLLQQYDSCPRRFEVLRARCFVLLCFDFKIQIRGNINPLKKHTQYFP